MIDENKVYDYIGIGFGPTNISVCIAIHELNGLHDKKHKGMFFERKEGFSWHPNMLLPDTTMQIHFMKDLVSLRNPTSYYSFSNYLKKAGRLEKFINLNINTPLRKEFNSYLSWASSHFDEMVSYNTEVISIEIDKTDKKYGFFKIKTKNLTYNTIDVTYTKALILSPGLKPKYIGDILPNNENIFHSSSFLNSISCQYTDRSQKYDFAVVGSGQSAAEIIEYIHSEYPNSRITSIQRGFAFKPSDDTGFVNELFFPEKTDINFNSSQVFRDDLVHRHRDTNYGVVDNELINQLYNIQYKEILYGNKRFFINNHITVNDVISVDGKAVVKGSDLESGYEYCSEFDSVFLATGFTPNVDLLSHIKDDFMIDEKGFPKTDRYYQVRKKSEDIISNLWVQGMTEATHGLSDTLLSVMAVRSGEIAMSLEKYLSNLKNLMMDDMLVADV